MRIFLFRSAYGVMALLSIHATVFGGEGDHAEFVPMDALKSAVYYAAHPREITLEHIQRLTSRELLLSECADYGALRRCTYKPAAEYANAPGLQSVTVSSTTSGASRGGFIEWQFPQTPCISESTVVQYVGAANLVSGLPPTFPLPPGTPESTSPIPDFRIYQSQDWDPAATLHTVTSKCIESISLHAQLPKE